MCIIIILKKQYLLKDIKHKKYGRWDRWMLCRKLKRLNGRIHIIIGNHDTDTRIDLYKQCPNVVSVDYSLRLKIKK